MAQKAFRTRKSHSQKHFDMCNVARLNCFDWGGLSASSVQKIQGANDISSFNFILSRKEFREQLKIMDEFIQPYITHALSLSIAELDQKLSTKETFLHSLARFTRDPRVLRDQLVAVLLAGCDTTAGTLSFTLFELGRNPHIVHRLREEIGSRLGLGTNARNPPIQI